MSRIAKRSRVQLRLRSLKQKIEELSERTEESRGNYILSELCRTDAGLSLHIQKNEGLEYSRKIKKHLETVVGSKLTSSFSTRKR